MSWVYNRGLVFVYEDTHGQWPLRRREVGKARIYGAVNIH
jgi:hypothetical protein